jgi:hypothetical protein
MERCGRAVGPENEAAYDAAMAAAGRSTGGQAGQNKSASAGGKEDCWDFLSLGTCSRGDDCGFNHDGIVAGSRRAAVVDKYGNCRQFVKHGDCRRKARGECPFLHKKRKEEEDALSSEQHAAILAYSEEKQKDATEVTWSAVSADGAAKWIAKAKEMELSAMSRPKVFPILEKRGKSKKVVSLEETEDIF